ncbi:MAG: serine/threonine-protein kinase, partial [Myxococcota bacterium]
MTDGSDAVPSDRDPFGVEGQTIGDKYRITDLIGQGGFGVVYRGVHRGFGEPIAVKCLRVPEALDAEARSALLTRLQDEGRVLHRLSKRTSGIVQALDVGAVTTPGGRWVPYLVMEWLDGVTLTEHVETRQAEGKRTMPLAEAIERLTPAALALRVAHEQGVAHRDVKPDNLFLTRGAGIKVLDFGIAKVLSGPAAFSAAPAATQRQPTAFTPSYGAPEQFNKKRGATGPWTDVFALALIVVELVRGARALDGDDPTQLYVASADPAARPTLRNHGVATSDEVEAVLAQALAVAPADRYQDAGAFWEALCAAADADPTTTTKRRDVVLGAPHLEPSPGAFAPTLASPGADGQTEETAPPDDVVVAEAPSPKPTDDDEAPSVMPPTRVASPSAPPPVPDGPKPPRASGGAPPSTVPPAEPRRPRPRRARDVDQTLEPETRASRWTLPVVFLLALTGAGLVYFELRRVEPPLPGDEASFGTGPLPRDPNAVATAAPPAPAA